MSSADGRGEADPGWRQREVALIALFMAINTLSFVDRQLPYIMVEPLKAEFGLTNFQFGLLTGPAFAAVYALASLPLAYFTDRRHAKLVLLGSLAMWTAMTGAGALAAAFALLLASRLGVALGEAGGTPAALKLIAQTIPERRRATAISLFSLGAPLGIMGGLALGGWLGSEFGWRGAFLAMVAPGVILLILAAWIVPGAGSATDPAEAPPRGTALLEFVRNRPFVWLCAAVASFGIAGYSIVTFTPMLLIRAFGLSTLHTGLWLGLVNGIAGGIGVFAGGYLVDRLKARDLRWQAWVPMAGVLLSVPLSVLAVFAPSATLSLLFIGLLAGTTLTYQAPSFALGIALVAPHRRATASAVLLVMSSLVGGLTGPVLVGWLADVFIATRGDDGLRLALLVIPAALAGSGFAYWRCTVALGAALPKRLEPDNV